MHLSMHFYIQQCHLIGAPFVGFQQKVGNRLPRQNKRHRPIPNTSMTEKRIQVSITSDPLPSIDTLVVWASTTDGPEAALSNGAAHPSGAVVTFSGIVRDDPVSEDATERIIGLDYDAYPALATQQLVTLLTPYLSSSVHKIAVHHRTGFCPTGTSAVVVVVAARHRREAFEIAETVMEEVKRKVGVWKRDVVVRGDGEKEIKGKWKANAECLHHRGMHDTSSRD